MIFPHNTPGSNPGDRTLSQVKGVCCFEHNLLCGNPTPRTLVSLHLF
jgi:hypothetical protein